MSDEAVYCDVVSMQITRDTCVTRRKQAQEYRDKGEPHASLEKCMTCKRVEYPAGTITTRGASKVCSYCGQSPESKKSVWVEKVGMHQSCQQSKKRGCKPRGTQETVKKTGQGPAPKKAAAAADVSNQSHYSDCGTQPIDFIRANDMDFLEGNVIKYVTRYKRKNGLEDLNKSRVYLNWLIEREEKKNEND